MLSQFFVIHFWIIAKRDVFVNKYYRKYNFLEIKSIEDEVNLEN